MFPAVCEAKKKLVVCVAFVGKRATVVSARALHRSVDGAEDDDMARARCSHHPPEK